ncbi:MAG: NADH-ubiquinone dehydrogenase, partial [Mesorhizobium sp.]
EDFRQPNAMEKPAIPADLKAISGIGPKLEKVLNGLGIWTYAQIAAWTPQEVAWVEDYLSLGGRIGRDDWKTQAAALA